ncbi:uncharacterized protein LOC124456543 [Xenia sp. Carnegie-2017]|uniref:uncharacterized protein LOC124456543 n=1 Tax=Xenia sp. Carnegie-2017 TaxID=2897299 RepID=UPI001F041DB1|nr:uncharacterized protein LOC124456543 [Xenia sp. Carnegie-2017]
MLPFHCGMKNVRFVRSALKISGHLNTVARNAQIVRNARVISTLGLPDRQRNGIQEMLKKNKVNHLAISSYNLSAACSSLLLTSDGFTTGISLVGSPGDEDDMATSGKKKHWIDYTVER